MLPDSKPRDPADLETNLLPELIKRAEVVDTLCSALQNDPPHFPHSHWKSSHLWFRPTTSKCESHEPEPSSKYGIAGRGHSSPANAAAVGVFTHVRPSIKPIYIKLGFIVRRLCFPVYLVHEPSVAEHLNCTSEENEVAQTHYVAGA